MIILVDAYNVLKRSVSTDISVRQREQFITLLGKYAHSKGHIVILVFDGGESSWPEIIKRDHAQVVYSGYKISADDYIHDYLERNKNKEIVLVSSDRVLCVWANQHEIASIDSDLFYRIVQQSGKALEQPSDRGVTSGVVKIAQATNAELDELMAQGAASIEYKAEDIRSKNGFTVNAGDTAKKDRKLLQILKKLY